MTTTDVRPRPKPILSGRRSPLEHLSVKVFLLVPLLALLAAVPLAWGWGLGWTDLGIAAGFYLVSCLGVTVGYHRYFTHGAFKARRALRVGLAIAGSLAAQGPVITWVADHRRHHAFSDRPGDPHSPWLYGSGPVALARGSGTPTWGGCSAGTRPTPNASPPTCSPTVTSAPSTGCSGCGPL